MPLKEDLKTIQIGVGNVINKKWQIVRKLGEGGCGVVYEAIDIQCPSKHVALKAEPFGMLKEDEILKMEGSNFLYVVMTLLGRSLSELRRMIPGQVFSVGTSMHLAVECLDAIEEFHKAGFIHRDIKPSNFAIGRLGKHARTVYIYDFGLARQYLMFEKGEPKLREPRKNVPFKGTVRYCSLNVHRREEHGRHDDLWHNMEREEAEKCKEASFDQLRRMTPKEFHNIFKHLRRLNYYKRPDYMILRDYFIVTLKNRNLHPKAPLDWEPKGLHGKLFNGGGLA
ncbi:CK1/TTBK protein kinase [Aphelenchoides avenae]|nr:CK1/TTBK protein kinase [Aphelenchus avenae]